RADVAPPDALRLRVAVQQHEREAALPFAHVGERDAVAHHAALDAKRAGRRRLRLRRAEAGLVAHARTVTQRSRPSPPADLTPGRRPSGCREGCTRPPPSGARATRSAWRAAGAPPASSGARARTPARTRGRRSPPARRRAWVLA